jgi:N4-gp56 family major capsid protein
MDKLKKILTPLFLFNLFLHADNTNVTGDSGMTVQMKTYYNKVLLENAFPVLVHNRYGQKRNIPTGGGKIIEFRKMTPFAKITTALSEGVTPDGQKLASTNLTATVSQYGGFFVYSDVLKTTTIDPVIQEGTELLGRQAGESIDTLTREVLVAATNVLYGDGSVTARKLLAAFDATRTNNDYATCEVIRRANLILRNNKARPIEGGDYVCIISPEIEYSLKRDSEWVEARKYQNSTALMDGEVGRIDGCRFVISTEAKIYSSAALTAASRTLTMASLATKTFTVDEAITSGEATALVGRHIWIKGVQYHVASAAAGAAGAATVTVTETVTGSPADGEIIYPGDFGTSLVEMPDKGADVGVMLFLGADAYGVTELDGLGLQTIITALGSAGAADPLKQRGTVGWKTTHVAKILNDAWLVRAEVALEHVVGAN